MPWHSDRNIAIFGGTQQGKTVGANQIYSLDGRIGVFFQPDPEPWLTGTRVRSIEQLAGGLKRGIKKFVVPLDLWSDVESEHERWTKQLLDICDRYPIRITMVHDEAQDLSQGILQLATKRGRKRGFRNIILTQSPAPRNVSLEPLRQCDYYVWVGPIGKFDVEYIENKGLFDAGPMLDNPEHKFLAIRRTGEVVDSGYFDNEKYGDG